MVHWGFLRSVIAGLLFPVHEFERAKWCELYFDGSLNSFFSLNSVQFEFSFYFCRSVPKIAVRIEFLLDLRFERFGNNWY